MNIKNHIFLIGAMKCGTSTIFKYLEQHPEICVPKIKEPEYFSQTMGLPKYKQDEYLDLFKFETQHKYTLDGSTGYSKFPIEKGVAKRISEANLNPKFIYIVRNPFDRIESHYNFMKKDLSWKNPITSDHLINVSNYQLQINQYLKYFKKEDILVLDFDELKNNPKNLLAKIYKFIGANSNVEVLGEIHNNKTKLVNHNELRLKKHLYGKLKWMPKPIKNFVKNIIFVKKKRTLSSNQKLKIKVALQEDLVKFGNDFQIDVEKWGFRKPNEL